jgi:hypothetical protein
MEAPGHDVPWRRAVGSVQLARGDRGKPWWSDRSCDRPARSRSTARCDQRTAFAHTAAAVANQARPNRCRRIGRVAVPRPLRAPIGGGGVGDRPTNVGSGSEFFSRLGFGALPYASVLATGSRPRPKLDSAPTSSSTKTRPRYALRCMRCPCCDVVLEAVVVEGQILERCARCGGCWHTQRRRALAEPGIGVHRRSLIRFVTASALHAER